MMLRTTLIVNDLDTIRNLLLKDNFTDHSVEINEKYKPLGHLFNLKGGKI